MSISNDFPSVCGSLNAFLDIPKLHVQNSEFGLLQGLTFAVKDVFDVVGYKTGAGNPDIYSESDIKIKNSPVVQKLLDSGASFIGKTQTEELVWSLSGLSTHHPPAINPAAPTRTTGGSSSGSAAAIAGEIVDIALGSDTVGSIRGPASFCGLIGLRTTHGKISLDGVFPGAPSLDVVGWYAKSIDIYEKVAQILLDKRSMENLEIKPIKLITLTEFNDLLLGNQERLEYKRMLTILTQIFGPIETIKPINRTFDELLGLVTRIRYHETWAFLGSWFIEKERNLMPPVKKRFLNASKLTTEQANLDSHQCKEFKEELRKIVQNNKIMVFPTTPSCSLLRTASHDEWDEFRNKAGKLFSLSSLSGFPEISIPLGTVHNAPFGVSLLGPINSDELLIKLARKVLQFIDAEKII